MSSNLNKSGIDYLRDSYRFTGRQGYSYNIISGCLNDSTTTCLVGENCYARQFTLRMSEHYPFGFLPTFYPNRLSLNISSKIPKLIFLNDMGDFAGNWQWISADDTKVKMNNGYYMTFVKKTLVSSKVVINLIVFPPKICLFYAFLC